MSRQVIRALLHDMHYMKIKDGQLRAETELSWFDGGIYTIRHADGSREAHGRSNFPYNSGLVILSGAFDYMLCDLYIVMSLKTLTCNVRYVKAL